MSQMVIDLMVPRKYLAWQMAPGVEILAILAVTVSKKNAVELKLHFLKCLVLEYHASRVASIFPR